VAREWHPTRNGDLKFGDVALSSGAKHWWKCARGRDHEWQASVQHRVYAETGCPHCRRERSSLAKAGPSRVVAEWHPSKNQPLTPADVGRTSSRRVWWQCSQDSRHVWRTEVISRTRETKRHPGGCPMCLRRRRVEKTARGRMVLVVAPQWHPTRNRGLRFEDVPLTSMVKYWWKCPYGPDHVWQATMQHRVYAETECPACWRDQTSFATNAPAWLITEWHPTRNRPLTPADVSRTSNTKIWWRCSENKSHVWLARVRTRTSRLATMPSPRLVRAKSPFAKRVPSGCPSCSRQWLSRERSLAARVPAVAAQWHPRRNGSLTPDQVGARSPRVVWWRCPAGPDHEWQAEVGTRTRGDGCPFCNGKRISLTNSLAAKLPGLVKLWHPTRNGSLTPRTVLPSWKRSYWWRCPDGPDHEWQRPVYGGHGLPRCPFCANQRVSITNCLATRDPRVASEWHPRLNGAMTPGPLDLGENRLVAVLPKTRMAGTSVPPDAAEDGLPRLPPAVPPPPSSHDPPDPREDLLPGRFHLTDGRTCRWRVLPAGSRPPGNRRFARGGTRRL
jgi:hypothetical protein